MILSLSYLPVVIDTYLKIYVHIHISKNNFTDKTDSEFFYNELIFNTLNFIFINDFCYVYENKHRVLQIIKILG